MMHIKSRQIIIVIVIALGLSVVAESSALAACGSSSCVGKIRRLYRDSANLYIATDGDESALNCTAPASKYVTIPITDPSFDRKYAMLLTALYRDTSIGLRITEGSSKCAISYIYMDK